MQFFLTTSTKRVFIVRAEDQEAAADAMATKGYPVFEFSMVGKTAREIMDVMEPHSETYWANIFNHGPVFDVTGLYKHWQIRQQFEQRRL